jgi:hypothetical protein
VAERADLVAPDGHGADRGALAEHRGAKKRSVSISPPEIQERVIGIAEDIRDVNDTTLEQRAPDRRAGLWDVHTFADEALDVGAAFVSAATGTPRPSDAR